MNIKPIKEIKSTSYWLIVVNFGQGNVPVEINQDYNSKIGEFIYSVKDFDKVKSSGVPCSEEELIKAYKYTDALRRRKLNKKCRTQGLRYYDNSEMIAAISNGSIKGFTAFSRHDYGKVMFNQNYRLGPEARMVYEYKGEKLVLILNDKPKGNTKFLLSSANLRIKSRRFSKVDSVNKAVAQLKTAFENDVEANLLRKNKKLAKANAVHNDFPGYFLSDVAGGYTIGEYIKFDRNENGTYIIKNINRELSADQVKQIEEIVRKNYEN